MVFQVSSEEALEELTLLRYKIARACHQLTEPSIEFVKVLTFGHSNELT